ncbi:cytochrome C oxidase subunit IV family protein [Mycobacterium sp.]|uniref:cytochrome C oxidase subunit IV family protein n=1 Tax=Mycobacterium sp. TaxID=1785 RepID=UPI003BB01F3B
MHRHQLASVIILLIAFIKVRLVGMYFMELREAPNVLRGLFEAYCVIVCSLLLGVFYLCVVAISSTSLAVNIVNNRLERS